MRKIQPDTMTYMYVQIDRFEDNHMAALLLFPDGKRSFDVPRELLPEEAQEGDVFDVRFESAPEESERLAKENRSLLDDLLKRDGG